MELYCILGIMLVTGILGGIVNFYSDANKQTGSESAARLRSAGVCILFGVAATILVPLFLKFAESKLLDEIKLPHKCTQPEKKAESTKETSAARVIAMPDSLQSGPQAGEAGSIKNTTKPNEPQTTSEEKNSLASDYLIWTAYCLLAACAGMRFIDLLMNKFLTQAQVAKLEKENQETKTEKTKLETKNNKLETEVENKARADEKRMKNLEISEQNIVEKLNSVSPAFTVEETLSRSINKEEWIPELPPIKFANDPQKGRFGGKSSFNGRTLSVTYEKYFLSDYLKLKIKVSADNNDNPLRGNVYLFLHDSFADSVVMYMAEGRTEIEHEVISYGAFTIGAALDNGNTLLELDIAELKNFPESFRNR